MKNLYWVRNDLRWEDNQTLNKFCEMTSEGIFVWCTTPSFLRAGPIRRRFILDSVFEFQKKVQDHGGTFLVFNQPATTALPKILSENKMEGLFYSAEYATEEIAEEKFLKKIDLKIFDFHQSSLIHPTHLPMKISDLPEQFTAFRKKVELNLRIESPLSPPPKVPACHKVNVDIDRIEDSDVADSFRHPHIRGGESFGRARLENYIWTSDCLKNYKETRNGLLDWNDSAKLSPWLSVGALSSRSIYQQIQLYEQKVIKNESTYWLFFELLWRDYFRFVSMKWGSRLFTQMKSISRDAPDLEKEKQNFKLWSTAQTGDAFVDANMNELNQTGWMSNRGRQNVASYLAKTLKVRWQWGAQHFEQQLIDYDVSSNWGNWAYLAGAGQDPRDRVFDTVKQAQLYDPAGHYRAKFCK